jgi:hypothetical protein
LVRGRGVGAGRVVEDLAFVVIPLPGDNSGVVPDLDGAGEDAEDCGGFLEGEQALVTQSLFAAAELVVVADVADGEPVEGAAFAAGQAAVVEDAGDLGVGVVIE